MLVVKDLIVKEQMPVDIKKPSPPLTDHQDNFKPEISSAGLSHKKEFVEVEIEIWLDDDQDQSVARCRYRCHSRGARVQKGGK